MFISPLTTAKWVNSTSSLSHDEVLQLAQRELWSPYAGLLLSAALLTVLVSETVRYFQTQRQLVSPWRPKSLKLRRRLKSHSRSDSHRRTIPAREAENEEDEDQTRAHQREAGNASGDSPFVKGVVIMLTTIQVVQSGFSYYGGYVLLANHRDRYPEWHEMLYGNMIPDTVVASIVHGLYGWRIFILLTASKRGPSFKYCITGLLALLSAIQLACCSLAVFWMTLATQRDAEARMTTSRKFFKAWLFVCILANVIITRLIGSTLEKTPENTGSLHSTQSTKARLRLRQLTWILIPGGMAMLIATFVAFLLECVAEARDYYSFVLICLSKLYGVSILVCLNLRSQPGFELTFDESRGRLARASLLSAELDAGTNGHVAPLRLRHSAIAVSVSRDALNAESESRHECESDCEMRTTAIRPLRVSSNVAREHRDSPLSARHRVPRNEPSCDTVCCLNSTAAPGHDVDTAEDILQPQCNATTPSWKASPTRTNTTDQTLVATPRRSSFRYIRSDTSNVASPIGRGQDSDPPLPEAAQYRFSLSSKAQAGYNSLANSAPPSPAGVTLDSLKPLILPASPTKLRDAPYPHQYPGRPRAPTTLERETQPNTSSQSSSRSRLQVNATAEDSCRCSQDGCDDQCPSYGYAMSHGEPNGASPQAERMPIPPPPPSTPMEHPDARRRARRSSTRARREAVARDASNNDRLPERRGSQQNGESMGPLRSSPDAESPTSRDRAPSAHEDYFSIAVEAKVPAAPPSSPMTEHERLIIPAISQTVEMHSASGPSGPPQLLPPPPPLQVASATRSRSHSRARREFAPTPWATHAPPALPRDEPATSPTPTTTPPSSSSTFYSDEEEVDDDGEQSLCDCGASQSLEADEVDATSMISETIKMVEEGRVECLFPPSMRPQQAPGRVPIPVASRALPYPHVPEPPMSGRYHPEDWGQERQGSSLCVDNLHRGSFGITPIFASDVGQGRHRADVVPHPGVPMRLSEEARQRDQEHSHNNHAAGYEYRAHDEPCPPAVVSRTKTAPTRTKCTKFAPLPAPTPTPAEWSYRPRGGAGSRARKEQDQSHNARFTPASVRARLRSRGGDKNGPVSGSGSGCPCGGEGGSGGLAESNGLGLSSRTSSSAPHSYVPSHVHCQAAGTAQPPPQQARRRLPSHLSLNLGRGWLHRSASTGQGQGRVRGSEED